MQVKKEREGRKWEGAYRDSRREIGRTCAVCEAKGNEKIRGKLKAKKKTKNPTIRCKYSSRNLAPSTSCTGVPSPALVPIFPFPARPLPFAYPRPSSKHIAMPRTDISAQRIWKREEANEQRATWLQSQRRNSTKSE